MDLAAEWAAVLRAESAGYAKAALASIRREFPSAVHHTMARPGDFPHRPRARTPVFYGSFDWCSSVATHWLLVRLLRLAGDEVPAQQIRTALNAQFSHVALVTEAGYLSGQGWQDQRPCGWGWALALAHEICSLAGPDAGKWSSAMAPLADAAAGCFLGWLGTAVYPVRHGNASNSAFAISRALGYARRRAGEGRAELLSELTRRALDWFGGDTYYPGGWEPSGGEFLSPALAEAELMASFLSGQDFADWLSMFLPGMASGEPAPLFTPLAAAEDGAVPVDGPAAAKQDAGARRGRGREGRGGAGDPAADGASAACAQDRACWHGLNAHRARAWRQVAAALPSGDGRVERALSAARAHAAAVLPHVLTADSTAGHWLPSYAVLMLS